jgi:hypothetical protein
VPAHVLVGPEVEGEAHGLAVQGWAEVLLDAEPVARPARSRARSATEAPGRHRRGQRPGAGGRDLRIGHSCQRLVERPDDRTTQPLTRLFVGHIMIEGRSSLPEVTEGICNFIVASVASVVGGGWDRVALAYGLGDGLGLGDPVFLAVDRSRSPGCFHDRGVGVGSQVDGGEAGVFD